MKILFKIVESIHFVFLGMNLIPIFLGGESYSILLAIAFSFLYGIFQLLKIPKGKLKLSNLNKKWKWISILSLIIFLFNYFLNPTDWLWLYLFFIYSNIILAFEIDKYKTQRAKAVLDMENILDSGEYGQK